MKTAILAGLCAFSSVVPTEHQMLSQAKFRDPEFPERVRLTEDLAQENLEINIGNFNKVPVNLFELNDEALEDSPQWLAHQVKAGGENGLKALIHGLRLSGINIGTDNGEIIAAPERAQGISLPFWRLQMMATGDNLFATHSLSAYTKGLVLFYKNVTEEKIQEAFLRDIQSMTASGDPGLMFFAAFVDQLSFKDGQNDKSYLMLNPALENDRALAKLTTLQMGLLALRFEAEYAVKYLGLSPRPRPEYKSFAKLAIVGCSANEKNVVNDAAKVKTNTAFSETFKITEADNTDSPANLAKRLGQFSNFLKSHAGLLSVLTSDVKNLTLIPTEPLIRTKTTSPGEMKNFQLKFTPKIKDYDEFNCFKTYAKDMGLIVKEKIGSDFLDGVKAQLTIKKALDKRRLYFDLNGIQSPSVQLKIDKNGMVNTPIWGMPQEKNLGAKVKPVLIDVPVLLEIEVELLNFIETDPTHNEEALLRALSEVNSASEASKKRHTTVIASVRDWTQDPEGSVTVKVEGHYSKGESRKSSDSWLYKLDVVDFTSTAILNFSEKTTMVQVWPDNIPLPPGLPPEFALPMLQINDTVLVYVLADVKSKFAQGEECDACLPNLGWMDIKRDFSEHKYGINMQAESSVMFPGPLRVNKRTKKITGMMAANVRNITSEWERSASGRVCPDSETTLDPDSHDKYHTDYLRLKNFEIEIDYEEVEGMAVVKKTFIRPFNLSVENIQTGSIQIPATIELKFDIRLPIL